MDGRARLLVQSGLLADPVKDLPVQGAVVIQEGLQLQKEACKIVGTYSTWKVTDVPAVAKNNLCCFINPVCLMIISLMSLVNDDTFDALP